MERVEVAHIEDEMRESYINYAMSVIRGRAIPDVRDGLKPVQRRILYGMDKLGLSSGKATRKSARIVGEVMGKYHPHGDQALYDTLVNMAQHFSFRYPLIDGQGNFGSIDGDEPAAMRYTEARLTPISEELLEEIQEETVDFGPNFDDSLQEPLVLPAKLPNLLLNGSWGISVGMTTQIPPHNLGEVIDALVILLKNPQASARELMQFIKGPDFPTGGIIVGREGIELAYRTGSGRILIRARAEVEDDRIIITEIPYQVRKSTLMESIARKVREGEITDIADLRDESDRRGLRIVIELKRGANPQLILGKLYKGTALEWTFAANFLVIIDGHPRRLPLKEFLAQFLHFRRAVVRRRTEHRLREAERRAHILEGYLKALERQTEVVEWISSARDVAEAQARLQAELELSELQAEEILKLRLRSFTALEREKLREEFNQKRREIAEYRDILDSPTRLDGVIESELLEMKERYSDPRRTEISIDFTESDPDLEELIPDEDLLVTITEGGYANAPREDVYRKQHRGGKGVIGMRLREGDKLRGSFISNSRDWIFLFTDAHKVYKLRAFQLPSLRRDARGENLRSLIELAREERIKALLPLKELDPGDGRFCLLATWRGMIICNPFPNLHNAHTKGICALRALPDDSIVEATLSGGEGEVILGTALGRTIRFPEKELRVSERPSRGVIGMRLNKGDRVVGLALLIPDEQDEHLLFVTERGFGKRTPLPEFHRQGRGGKGILGIRVDKKTGEVVALRRVGLQDELLITTAKGKTIRIATSSIRIVSRYAKGVRLINLDSGDRVVSAVKVCAQ